MDTHKLRNLLDQRDAIDDEIAGIVNGTKANGKERKPQACSTCGEVGHSSRTCTKKEAQHGTQTLS